MSLTPYLHRVVACEDLPAADAYDAMCLILGGRSTSAEIAALLTALRMKGEKASELLGFARAMREFSTRIVPRLDGEPLVDTCGMGGDGAGTFNISTVAAFVVAAAGVRVAKHGNRSISSRCGSADLLERLGIKVDCDAVHAARAIEEVGIGFLFAPSFHPAMRHAHAARTELRMRTVFNLLGPLTNPAGATVQVVGAASPSAARLMAETLAELGLPRGFVVHGSDGLDEITICGETALYDICNGRVFTRTLSPEDFGFECASLDELRGGLPEENAEIALRILEGAPGPKRGIVLMNASAALVAAGRAGDFCEGVEVAAQAVDSGAALERLRALSSFTTKAAV
jgi:anthranilate phosphoribosyltransferase